MDNRRIAYLLFGLSFVLLLLVIASLIYKISVFNAKCFDEKKEVGGFIKQQASEINALKEENEALKEGAALPAGAG